MKRNAINLQRFILSGSLAGVMMASPSAFAQTAKATDDLNVNATLSTAFSISCGTALNFGEITLPIGKNESVSVEIAMDNTQTVTSTGSTTNVSTTGTTAAGSCSIAGGTPNGSVGITYLNDDDTDVDEITLGGDGSIETALNDLKVDTFVPSEDSNVTGTLDGDGKGTIDIGATLQIPANLDADNMGDYSGLISVEVEDIGT